MWKIKFWLAIAKMYNRLAGVTSGVTKKFIERCNHGINKYYKYYFKYIESKERNHECLK